MYNKKQTSPTLKQNKLIQDAVALHQSGQLDLAEAQYRKLLTVLPGNTVLLTNLGSVALQRGHLEEAVRVLRKSLQINPNQYTAHYNCGIALQYLKRSPEALLSYDNTINLKPDFFEALINRGIVLKTLNRPDEALDSYDRAITLKPDQATVYFNRGIILTNLSRYEEALVSYDRAITLKFDYADAYTNRGNVLKRIKRFVEALDDFTQAKVLKPDDAEACMNYGNVLCKLDRSNEALDSYAQAITLNPAYAEAYYNQGNAFNFLHRLDEAVESYDRAITLKPDIDFILGISLYARMRLCIWERLSYFLNEIIHQINRQEPQSTPFLLFVVLDDPEIHFKAAKLYFERKYCSKQTLPKIVNYPIHNKIRIGYFSADFKIHPVAYLTANLFETHDKNLFEIYAFSIGLPVKDEMRLRIEAGVDHFFDVLDLSDKDIVLLARKNEIDIVVDLGGYTDGCRPTVFGLRAAPVQINYLGYPGTTGIEQMDYIVGDHTLIPEDKQHHYSEKIIYLPNSYMVNDRVIPLDKLLLTKKDVGLPTSGFVFCCFNNHYKITPSTFEGWMRILKEVDGSFLWLATTNDSALARLKENALKNNINPNRLLFAPRLVRMEDHLKRIPMADLFLDTFPYNAHATASDALRMGLPIVTCMGKSFASRVAASLLNAVNLPELITTSQEQYESLAIELATHPEKLKVIKNKLAINLPTAPLYNTALFTKHLESAYLTIYDRSQKGLDAEHIYVAH